MTETNKLSSHQEEENKVTKQQTDKQEEIKKALTTDYYGSFDQGTHPGQYDVYEDKDLEKTGEIPNLVLGENDFLVKENVEPEIYKRLEENEAKLPRKILLEKLKKHQTVSCELHRRTKEGAKDGKGWNKAIGSAGWFEYVGLGEIFTMQKENLEGNIVLYLTFQPTKTDPLTLEISSKLVEFPNQAKGDMINKGIVFSKTLNGKEFEQEQKI